MGMYKYLQQSWQSPEMKEILRQRMIDWRKEPSILRIEHPSRLDRAHALGYKAKQGFVLARVHIGKGTSKREVPSGGRKPAFGQYAMPPDQNLQHIAEMRVGKAFPNLEVINSYYVAEDGRDQWFEVILVDPNHPAIKSDRTTKWVCNPANRGRVFRGLTSAGKAHRGLRFHGKGFERRNDPQKR
ncbi:MAG: 50S ribosomal protein L15e [Candidatus Aenigmatarchaeota archaeon]